MAAACRQKENGKKIAVSCVVKGSTSWERTFQVVGDVGKVVGIINSSETVAVEVEDS